jgi:hypothetical protein
MNKFFTTLLTLAAVSVALPAGLADHCTSWNTEAPEVDSTLVGGAYYVDNDVCQPECIFSIWVYEESNGIAGLQRGDEVVDSTCHGQIDADTIIF